MLKTLRRMNLGGWPCLLALVLHLAAPLSQGARHFPHTYDDANNRDTKTVTRISGTSSAEAGENDIGFWDYNYNAANQLTGWEKWDTPAGTLQKTATLAYDEAGNRTSQTVDIGGVDSTTTYTWDAQDRLASVTMPAQPGTANSEPRTFTYAYDYRTRRIGTHDVNGTTAKHTAIVFSGGLSVAEWETSGSPPSALSSTPTVEYTRGPDMGGGVGGMLYSQRTSPSSSTPTLRYSVSNGRGDIVAQADSSATLTWTASYEAYGKRTKETGENKDKQRGNSKDEDPTGLLNEGFRYRDIETGVWLSRDPAGFVDGPNLYAYVMQNPWTGFDPDGLKTVKDYENDIQAAKARRDASLAKLKESGHRNPRMEWAIERNYKKDVRAATDGIKNIVATARMMEHYNRSTGLEFTDADIATFDDESRTFKSFKLNQAVLGIRPFSSTADHLMHGEFGEAGKAALKEAAVWAAFAVAGKLVAMIARPAAAANNGAPAFRTWNQFQSGTAGQFATRAEAGAAWSVYKDANGIVTGATRSTAARSEFLRGMAESGKSPSWMNQWLQQGKVPPGYHVDHIKPLSIGGPDTPANMRLLDIDMHKMHHRYYRPWE